MTPPWPALNGTKEDRLQMHSIFPTLMMQENLRRKIDLDEMAADIIEERKSFNHYTSFHTKGYETNQIYDISGMNELRDNIGRLADNYLDIISHEKRGPHKVSMWWNVMEEHDSHQLHIHPSSNLSGCFYVRYNDDCAHIAFRSPFEAQMMHQPQKHLGKYYSSEWRPRLRSGDILIWPAWLYHEVRPQLSSTEKRISVAFNVDFR
jgi:uncharacterized protein (TIGR02466 family)